MVAVHYISWTVRSTVLFGHSSVVDSASERYMYQLAWPPGLGRDGELCLADLELSVVKVLAGVTHRPQL